MRKEPKGVCLPPKPEVLIVVGPGGVIEVYTSRYMRVKIAKKLRGLPDTAEAELVAEEYLESHLPKWARELYCPVLLRKLDTVRLLTPSEESYRRLCLDLVGECRKITKERTDAQRIMDTINNAPVASDVCEEFDF